MEAQSKWLWAVTLANTAVASLLLLVIYGMMLGLAVLAPEISGWPLYILLPIGLVLSLTGLRFTKGNPSRASRRVASVLNASALILDLLVILGLATMFFGSTKERFLIPDGYKGDVFVLYGAQDGESLSKSRGKITYRIPKDGILRTREPMLRGSTRTEYYYLRQDGSLVRIGNFWPATIPQTPENLANDEDIGVFFPRTGTFADSTGCSVQFEQFYVGTKAHLLSKYRQNDLGRYVRDHFGACSNRKAQGE
jgi:hypothetical protein